MHGRWLQQKQSIRWHWQAFLQKRYDPSTGTWKYEGWDVVMKRSEEPNKHGKSLTELEWKEDRHIKPTEAKRRLVSRKRYNNAVKRLDDLMRYIKFTRDYKDDFRKDTNNKKWR
jgi:hypothetical protein